MLIKLSDILSEPGLLPTLSVFEISKIISEARYHNMLAQLKYLCVRENIWEQLPLNAKKHLESAELKYISQRKCLDLESTEFYRHLKPLNIDWVYLKGAAYLLCEIEEFKGRLMGDIDILVSESDLPLVESKLSTKGWVQSYVNDHDEKFYREWSQEIPPLRHIERRTELDLHFNILPKTLRKAPSSKLLMQYTEEVEGYSDGPKVFTPPAMVIHSAIHLFHESDYSKALRDLYDLYTLFKSNSGDEKFWRDLIKIQDKMGNADSVYLALRYCYFVYQFSPPAYVIEYYKDQQPNIIIKKILDFSYINVFSYSYSRKGTFGYQLSELILYWRGHIKRMPLYLLIPHLAKKTLSRLINKDKEQEIIM